MNRQLILVNALQLYRQKVLSDIDAVDKDIRLQVKEIDEARQESSLSTTDIQRRAMDCYIRDLESKKMSYINKLNDLNEERDLVDTMIEEQGATPEDKEEIDDSAIVFDDNYDISFKKPKLFRIGNFSKEVSNWTDILYTMHEKCFMKDSMKFIRMVNKGRFQARPLSAKGQIKNLIERKIVDFKFYVVPSDSQAIFNAVKKMVEEFGYDKSTFAIECRE